jgi:hypothetical protein
MKMRILLFALINILFVSISFAQSEDDGYTSDIHEKYNSKIVFSKSEVLYQQEDINTFTSDFSYGDPVYGRAYWYPGLNNIYEKLGWSGESGYFYLKEVYLNDKLIVSYYEETENGGRTTLPICLQVADDDYYEWSDKRILPLNYEYMKEGKNIIKMDIYPYNVETKEKGTLMSSGTFSFIINKESIISAGNYIFTGLKTKWSSGDDIWNEWDLYVQGKNAKLTTQWKGEIDKWDFYIGMRSGEIETVFSGDYTKFELTTNDVKVTMKRTFSSDWNRWEISDGNLDLDLRTTWSSGDDMWKEWDLKGNGGSMKIKTSWSSGDDIWKEWKINDNLNASPELKMAAVFIVMFNSCLL